MGFYYLQKVVEYCCKLVINVGDGVGEYLIQVLLDVFIICEEIGIVNCLMVRKIICCILLVNI